MITRRRFLKASSAATAGAVAVYYVNLSNSLSLFGTEIWAGALGLACVTLLDRSYGSGLRGRDARPNALTAFPMTIGPWTGSRSAVGESVYKILETDTVLVARYTNGRDVVSLSTVYYPEAKVDFHNPEECNAGAGDIVDKEGTRDVKVRVGGAERTIRANVFTVEGRQRGKELFYFFFKAGDFAGNRYLDLRLEMALRLIRSRETSGALLVYSSPIRDDRAAAEGIRVTQATLSRDLHELNLVKTVEGYKLPGQLLPNAGSSQQQRHTIGQLNGRIVEFYERLLRLRSMSKRPG